MYRRSYLLWPPVIVYAEAKNVNSRSRIFLTVVDLCAMLVEGIIHLVPGIGADLAGQVGPGKGKGEGKGDSTRESFKPPFPTRPDSCMFR